MKDAVKEGYASLACPDWTWEQTIEEANRGDRGNLEARGYDGWLSLEYEKKWKPELEEPEVSLPAYMNYIQPLISRQS